MAIRLSVIHKSLSQLEEGIAACSKPLLAHPYWCHRLVGELSSVVSSIQGSSLSEVSVSHMTGGQV